MTNKELFEQQMNILVEAINDKTGSSGKKTLDEVLESSTVITNTNYVYALVDALVDPVNFEYYLTYDGVTIPTEEEVEAALQKICADYGASYMSMPGEDWTTYIILFTEAKILKVIR